MTTGGWLTMLLSVGSVVTLFVWCLYRVLCCAPKPEQLHGIEDIDTKDTNAE
jgi:uncharacterized membrane protein